MSGNYQINIVSLEPSDFGPQAIANVTVPNGDKYMVRCLARPEGITEIFEYGLAGTMDFLINSFGTDIVAELRDATCRAM